MSLLDLPKVSEEVATIASGNVENADKRNSASQVMDALPAPVTQTDKAHHDYYLQVQQLEGVQVHVSSGGETWGKRPFLLWCQTFWLPRQMTCLTWSYASMTSIPWRDWMYRCWNPPVLQQNPRRAKNVGI